MNPTGNAKHTKLASLMDNTLECQKTYHEARIEQDYELYERQIKL